MTTLAAILERLKDNESLLSHGEEGTRQVAILPVLAALGWNRDDLNEVEPEHPVGTGRVDYCLRHQNRSTVFIEVKRTGTDLEPHQQQLLNYAFQEGVSLAVLTDGLVWWLYLPREGGSWEQRKFFSVDCRVLAPDGAAEALERYLQREAVLAGTAQERAIAELKGQQRNQRFFPMYGSSSSPSLMSSYSNSCRRRWKGPRATGLIRTSSPRSCYKCGDLPSRRPHRRGRGQPARSSGNRRT